jgi:Leucine-rich repeat (LRR) protein
VTLLVVDNNLLRKLPDAVLKLPSLAVLQAAGNTITHLPEDLGRMHSLQGLILSTNQVCFRV